MEGGVTQIDQLLIEAVINNDDKRVGELLNLGANPNVTSDRAQVTPLHHAAQNNSAEVVPLLMVAGAQICAQTEPEGYTPLEIALSNRNPRVAQILLAYLQPGHDTVH